MRKDSTSKRKTAPTKTTRPRLKNFAITGKWGNATDYSRYQSERIILQYEDGDICTVNVGAPYGHGDIVLAECSEFCTAAATTPHYHAKFFLLNRSGKKYKFSLSRTDSSGSGKRYKKGDEKIIIGPIVKVNKSAEPLPAKRDHEAHRAGFDWPYFGVHRGDLLTVETGAKVSIGQLVYVKSKKDPDHAYFNRITRIDGETVRLTDDEDGEPVDRPLDFVIGSVVEIKHDECAHAKIEALRARLDALRDDDDHTLNVTKAYEVEREIYDLEHPKPEDITEEDDSILDADLIGDGGAR